MLEELLELEYLLWPVGSTEREAERFVASKGGFSIEENEVQIPLSRELQAGEYQIKLRAYYGEKEYSDWTETISFKVEDSPETELLTVYPNPYTEFINLLYQSPKNDEMVLEITDANSGKLLFEELMEAFEGENEWKFSVPKTSSEVVILKLYSITHVPIIKKLTNGR